MNDPSHTSPEAPGGGSAPPPESVQLRRSEHGRPAAPVRMVHLGIGNFFRAHQAWFTEHSADAADWGYAAFTGRTPDVAEDLATQEDLYTLLVREPDGDRPEVISSLSATHAGADVAALRGYFASPELALVTSTVTEAGYRRATGGGLDLTDTAVAADVEALRTDASTDDVSTTPGRLVAGLLARRAAGAGPIALVPCDNVPHNGAMVGRVVRDLAAEVDATLLDWIEENVAVVTTMVDRITPRATEEDRATVAELLGVEDRQVVVTEPFSEWVLSGEFPRGRPEWPGAQFVDDVSKHEQRKLWLLNGSHSLMAYGASILGHETVSSAITDDTVRGWVEEWWDVAAANLDVEGVEDYRAALVERFSNPRIKHLLAQIAADGSQKVPIRFGPALAAEAARGSATGAAVPVGATRPVAAWIAHLHGHGAPVTDAQQDTVRHLASADPAEAVRTVLGWMGIEEPGGGLVDQVLTQVGEFEAHQEVS
ncbi:mannitol dehydrogenase family protein [Ornithinimicrobium sp. F0845]|uniref:mannitol dehydrogenase family protein n=1 Tax=Ornithinimicrobium sp. F0845 TaxID=2926412 RepID=UPI001FF5AE85|nr:mannitol dehydrogenase family protein [Ornithinimicrobium sp. F0845]MCK0110649.1 mannitol dehydrogenase family protein [Ornithinimicrobium sp. F0845]